MLPNIVRLQLEEEHNGDFKYAIFNTDDNRVGRVAISLWPNQPMLYLTQIEIEKDHQERGFGTATGSANSIAQPDHFAGTRERGVFRLLGKNAQP